MGLHDRTGANPLRMYSHVRITHPRHAYYGLTGTVIQVDLERRRVWVQLADGTTTRVSSISVEVLTTRRASR